MFKPGHEEHAEALASSFKQEMIVKYLKGAAEHQGHILDIPIPGMINNGIEEAIDQAVYMKTLQQQIKFLSLALRELFSYLNDLEEPLNEDALEIVQQIKELLGIL